MEIFISLTASLYDRIKYAGFVVTFLGIWRNYLIFYPEYDLNTNFITRETFQDIILSCHMAVNLIALFAEKYSYLECALDLTGTDCVETYFSMNGSWVVNKHAYTILDMIRNLKSMNRLSEISSTNPHM